MVHRVSIVMGVRVANVGSSAAVASGSGRQQRCVGGDEGMDA